MLNSNTRHGAPSLDSCLMVRCVDSSSHQGMACLIPSRNRSIYASKEQSLIASVRPSVILVACLFGLNAEAYCDGLINNMTLRSRHLGAQPFDKTLIARRLR